MSLAQPQIGLITMVRDEQRLIGEFIAHHVGLGIERIHVLDNGSTDATAEILATARAGLPGLSTEAWDGGQVAGFTRGLEVMRQDVDWVLAIDCDEFLVAPTGQALTQFLAGMGNCPAIGLHWAIFGSAGLIHDPGDLFTASFLRRAPDRQAENRHIKSLVQTSAAREAETPHTFRFNDHKIDYVNCVRQKLTWAENLRGFCVNPPVLAPFRLHHYFCRYRDSWDEKIARSAANDRTGHSGRGEADWTLHDRNELEDRSALRHTLKTRGILNRLGLAIAPPDLGRVGAGAATPSTRPQAAPLLAEASKPSLPAWPPTRSAAIEPAVEPPSTRAEGSPQPRTRTRTKRTGRSWMEDRAAELIAAAEHADGGEAAWLRRHAGWYAAWAAELAAL